MVRNNMNVIWRSSGISSWFSVELGGLQNEFGRRRFEIRTKKCTVAMFSPLFNLKKYKKLGLGPFWLVGLCFIGGLIAEYCPYAVSRLWRKDLLLSNVMHLMNVFPDCRSLEYK